MVHRLMNDVRAGKGIVQLKTAAVLNFIITQRKAILRVFFNPLSKKIVLVLLITLTIAQFYIPGSHDYVTVSRHAQYQDPETETPTVTCQNAT